MTSTGARPRTKKKVDTRPPSKPRSVRFVTVIAFVLPGSGQVFNGDPTRGVIMQFGMLFMGFITWQLTDPSISTLGRIAGGLLVYVFSVVDANGVAKRRVQAWARVSAGKPAHSGPRQTQPGRRNG